MKPEIDVVFQSMMMRLVTEVAPAVADGYVRSNVEVMAGILIAATEEIDRAAAMRVEENAAIRALFRDAIPSLSDAALRGRLAEAAAEGEPSLRISELNRANDRLRRLLIELHAFVEEHDQEWARRIDRAIWEELRAGTERRAISFNPF